MELSCLDWDAVPAVRAGIVEVNTCGGELKTHKYRSIATS
jgi:hypothetical protein